MAIVPQTLHTFKDGDTHVAAQLDGGNVVLGQTRNEENAAEGRFNLVTVIPLQEAIAIAKAVLAMQEQEELDRWMEERFEQMQDHKALADSALEHDITF